ncbi:MAG TPA: isochorismatase family cysteine hydrolase [Luteolibacter sp.]
MNSKSSLANTALLLIDVINDMAFEGGSRLLRHALPAAKKIARLRDRMRQAGVPVIYVNDNFGRWDSDFNQQIQRCLAPECPGSKVAGLLAPAPTDYFVLKPKHSGFYSTSLELLLRYLGIQRLILTGFATDICVIYTANDAYMRDYDLIVPSDCVASETAALNQSALKHIRHRLKARVCLSKSVR